MPAHRRLRAGRLRGPSPTLLIALFVKNSPVYGRRKLTKAARKAGLDAGRDQVPRLMRVAGIRGATRARRRFTIRPDPLAV